MSVTCLLSGRMGTGEGSTASDRHTRSWCVIGRHRLQKWPSRAPEQVGPPGAATSYSQTSPHQHNLRRRLHLSRHALSHDATTFHPLLPEDAFNKRMRTVSAFSNTQYGTAMMQTASPVHPAHTAATPPRRTAALSQDHLA